ncbi:MAG: TetR/AcrR family transcriptional regulator [Chitinophagaceae bacterium]|jgi:AcrR family transcriptional regulator
MSKAEKTRAYIIEAAAPVFNVKGYALTAISDIMEATKLTKGSIYGNFADKQELAIASYQYNVAGVESKLNAALTGADNAYGQLLAFTNYYRGNCKNMFAFGGCPILNAAIEADDNLAYLKPHVQKSILNLVKKISNIIKEGQAKNEFRANVNAEEFAYAIVGLLEGSIMMAKIMNKPNLLFAGLDRIVFMADTELKI